MCSSRTMPRTVPNPTGGACSGAIVAVAVAVAPDHPAAGQTAVTLADLSGDTFLISSNRFGGMLAVAGSELGFQPRLTTVADLHLVADGSPPEPPEPRRRAAVRGVREKVSKVRVSRRG